MWVRPADTQQRDAVIIDFNFTSSPNKGLTFMQRDTATNNFDFLITNGTSGSFINYRLEANKWQYLVFEREGGTIRLFINGNQVASKSCFGIPIAYNPGSNVAVGYGLSVGHSFSGPICNVQIWDFALSQDSIQSYFNNCVTAPVLSVPAGTYDTPQTISMSCNTIGAIIRYTTDGNNPTYSTVPGISSGYSTTGQSPSAL